jgi:predicted nucleic acid-binding protein
VIVIDSSGWIEYFMDEPLADDYEQYILNPSEIITPTIAIYEVYKRLNRELGEDNADLAPAKMLQTNVVPLNDYLAMEAANTSLTTKLAMADAIIYTTAQEYGVQLVTSDSDLQNLPGVLYLPKPKP